MLSRLRTEPRLPEDAPMGTLAKAASAGVGAWLLATAASQHPHRAFDRFRDFDPTGLLVPNWRFFAPEPAQHDFHLLHRVLTADEHQTPWCETSAISPRKSVQSVWFPARRREKAMFDVCNELIMLMSTPRLDLTRTVPFELLRNHVELQVRESHDRLPQGFQFLIARHTGHDESEDPDYLLASPFIPLKEDA
jgi:hypothetical protein